MSAAAPIELTIDGKKVAVATGTTVFDAARMNGIAIPTLCHQQNETPVGVCRVCVVDVGARVFTASCVRPAEPGMVVNTSSEKVQRARRMLVEMLMADHPAPCARQQHSGDCELEALAKQENVLQPRFARRTTGRAKDGSSLSIAVDFDACILCDRCIRGCGEIRENFVLGRMGKGAQAGIAFDDDRLMGESSCVSCGECMVSCPTGALTNKGVTRTALGSGPDFQKVSPDELQQLPVFKGVSGTFLSLNQGAVVKRRFKAGELICREGEYGSTAFYILEGKAQVSISTPMAHVKTQGGIKKFIGKLSSRLAQRQQDRRDEEADQRWIPIDAPMDLSYDNPVAQLGPGDLFGEMTCMSLYPRSATVIAATDCTVLEMLRNVLDIMQRNKNFRAQLDQSYRRRALDSHLRAVPVFAELTEEFIGSLRETVELLRYSPGQVICRQGELADSFYLVRIGFVKVSQAHPGGDMVLAYLSRGDYFGETGLLAGDVRTATCTALDHVELVRIGADDFTRMIEQFPEVRRKLEVVERERSQMNRERLSIVQSVPLDNFLAQGLMEAQSLLLLDLNSCTRCDACVRACADAHDGVTRLVREGLRFDHFLVATSCRQCLDPLCMVGCPVGSIRRRNSLEVIIEDWCIGCGLCAENCPYGNINLHPFEVMADDPGRPGHKKAAVKQKATSCDLCTDHAEPSCVYACPHDAAHRVDPRKFFADLLGQAPGDTQNR
ncbi:MAG TPA: cyclic nucleotide-binding domain-containing protein [Candidatus Acidoferrales bacterium]|nr:cyclic nucleotide-binding domain-containing protein [Candidatus Acidoferrales bacterium]